MAELQNVQTTGFPLFPFFLVPQSKQRTRRSSKPYYTIMCTTNLDLLKELGWGSSTNLLLLFSRRLVMGGLSSKGSVRFPAWRVPWTSAFLHHTVHLLQGKALGLPYKEIGVDKA